MFDIKLTNSSGGLVLVLDRYGIAVAGTKMNSIQNKSPQNWGRRKHEDLFLQFLVYANFLAVVVKGVAGCSFATGAMLIHKYTLPIVINV